MKKLFFIAAAFLLNCATLHAESANKQAENPTRPAPVTPDQAAFPPDMSYNGMQPVNITPDPTGNTSAIYRNADGTHTMVKRNSSGKTIHEQTFGGMQMQNTGVIKGAGILTELKAGESLKAEGNADGTRTVTKTDSSGKIISQETHS